MGTRDDSRLILVSAGSTPINRYIYFFFFSHSIPALSAFVAAHAELLALAPCSALEASATSPRVRAADAARKRGADQ